MNQDTLRIKTRNSDGEEKVVEIPVDTAVTQLRRKRRRAYAAMTRHGMPKLKAFETVLGQY